MAPSSVPGAWDIFLTWGPEGSSLCQEGRTVNTLTPWEASPLAAVPHPWGRRGLDGSR